MTRAPAGASPCHVLVVADDPATAGAVSELLVSGDAFAVTHLPSLDHAAASRVGTPACLVTAIASADGDAPALLCRIDRMWPGTAAVVLTDTEDEAFALAALEAGAQECLGMDRLGAGALPRAVRRAVARRRSEAALARLREAEERFGAFDESPIGMGLANAQDGRLGALMRVNRALAAIFRRSEGELLGLDPASLVDERDRRALTGAVKAIVGGLERTAELELRFPLPDGNTGWLHVTVSTLREHRSPHPVALLQLQDATKRRRAEAALRSSEAANSAILESALDCVVCIDAQGRVEAFNAAAEATFGYTRDAALGRDLAELIIPPRFRDGHRGALTRVGEGRSGALLNRRVELVGMRSDGSEFPLEAAIVPTAGRTQAFTGFLRDLSERRRSEEIAARLAAIVESSEDAIVGMDLGGRITSWNRGAERLYGYTPVEAVGRTMHMLLLDKDAEEGETLLANLARGERTSAYETRRRRRDGSVVDIAVSLSPVRDAVGHVIGGASIARDITAKKRAEAALALSELRYRRLLSQLPDAAFVQYDRDLRIVFAEGALLGALGHTPASIVGKTLPELRPAAQARYVSRTYGAALEGKSIGLDSEAIGDRFVDIDIVPMRDAEGGIVGGMALARDVTARRRIEDSLHFQAELLDRLDVAVVATDPDGLVTHWNRQAERFYTRSCADAIGRPFAEISNTWGLRDTSRTIAAMRSGEIVQEELGIPLGDGGALPVLMSNSAVRDEDGEIVGYVSVALDVTNARHAAEQLHSARELFVSAFEHAPIGIVLVRAGRDGGGTLMRVNRTICDTLGMAPADVLGRGYGDFVHPEDAPRIHPEIQRVLRGEAAGFHATVRLAAAGGRTVWADLGVSIVRDAAGVPEHAVVLLNDITEARYAEAEKAALEARLHQSQKLDSIGRLAGGIAHDFNNLLAIIINYAEMVAERLTGDEELRADVEEIAHAAERAAALTRQLLVFARREVVQPRATDLNAILADTETLLRRAVGENVRLVTEPADGLWPVQADRSQIEQVLMNLTINARDAMPGGGEVRVSTANIELDEAYVQQRSGVTPGRHARITVTDTGSGMEQEVLERAFEPFYTTKGPGKGTGLGLATVYGIVTQSGGHIDIYSEPGRGTTVRVDLPVCAAADEDPGQDMAAAPGEGRGERVLVVEDEVAVRALTARLLASAGYDVLEAHSPEDALAMLGDRSVDVLLTDVVMPTLSGSELARLLRSQHPDLRVVFMSGYTDDVVMRHGLFERGLAFVEKPFTRTSLLRGLRDVIEDAVTEDVDA